MHHRLQALADGAESGQAQQVQRCGSQRYHHSVAVTAVAVIFFSQLGAADSVPALQAPALPHQMQHASGVVRRFVMNRWMALNGLPSRIPVAITSAIQLVPCQLALTYSVAPLRVV
jgi:hypothetical protein